MNGGTNRRQAYGFEISSLTKRCDVANISVLLLVTHDYFG